MAQTFFKNLVSVDWLSMTVRYFDINALLVHDHGFIWHVRPYGSKQYRQIVDIDFFDAEGISQPFGVFMFEPTLENWDRDLCSLKLANNLFYCDAGQLWQDLLTMFLCAYRLEVISITRCDLACDFLFLLNRVSGPQLVEKLKSCKWWKCGTSKCVEYYKMPYTIKSSSTEGEDESQIDIYLQQGQFVPRVESLTFGTMASDAQVCIYDKTLEIMRTEQEIKLPDRIIRVSAKEYIREAHKVAGVHSDERHTWRVEIRLRNNACFLLDTSNGVERPLVVADLQPKNLPHVFRMAADRYFRLVDATKGGSVTLTPEYVQKMASHKDRLPIVDLFREKTLVVELGKKKYQKNPTRFTKAVINMLEDTGDEMELTQAGTRNINLLPNDANVLREAAMVLRSIYAGQYADLREQREELYESTFRSLYDLFNVCEYIPRRVVDTLYKYIFSRRYVQLEFLREVVRRDPYCNFNLWLKCNCNIDTYYKTQHIPCSDDRWIPPSIAPENSRNIPTLLTDLLYEQHPSINRPDEGRGGTHNQGQGPERQQ